MFETRSLLLDYPAAESFQAIASGVLALEISRVHHNYILWFSPEVIQTVKSIECDRAQINELFTNLMSNAIKYNDKAQKWVEIGFIQQESEARSRVALEAQQRYDPKSPIFYVRDNGIGIPQEHLEKIFEIFRRLHGRDEFGGGTCAGLTIARKIAERHGGRIWVESIPTQGSTFYFTLSAEATA